MPRNLFAVIFTEELERGKQIIGEKYPNAYPLAQDAVIVSADEALSKDIAKAAGLTKDQGELGVRGAVFKLNGSYTGYAPSDLWEWLDNVTAESL